MAASPLAFFRGAATIMAHDLHATPTSGLSVQLSGDAHLLNFGGFASPERARVFDLNDFDETLRRKVSVDVERLRPRALVGYARASGWTLARAHARSGDRVAIAAYLGSGDAFDQAVEALLDAVPDLRPVMQQAPPDELTELFAAFDLTATYDKHQSALRLAATLVPTSSRP